MMLMVFEFFFIKNSNVFLVLMRSENVFETHRRICTRSVVTLCLLYRYTLYTYLNTRVTDINYKKNIILYYCTVLILYTDKTNQRSTRARNVSKFNPVYVNRVIPSLFSNPI